MEIIKAVLFGIVEGITEWLPVSSTGHMILLDEFIQLKGNEEFINVFLVVIQLGAIFAVVLQFWSQLFPFQWKDKRKPFVEMERFCLPVFRRRSLESFLTVYSKNCSTMPFRLRLR